MPRTRLCPLVLGMLTLVGCLGVIPNRKEEWSTPAPRTEGEWRFIESVWPGGLSELVGPSVHLVIESKNQRRTNVNVPIVFIPLPPIPTTDHDPRPFTIRVNAIANVDGLALDPTRTILVVKRRRELPRRVTDCPENGVPGNGVTGAVALPPETTSCHVLEYDRNPPHPKDAFSLTFEGLSRDGARVDVPPIRFEGRSRWAPGAVIP